jgi:hypothetical protein
MRLTAAAALTFGAEALAAVNQGSYGSWSTCTSSTCQSATDGLGLGSGYTSSWGSATADPAYSSTAWGSWSADPATTLYSSTTTTTTVWATWSADPTDYSATTTWGSWSADPTDTYSATTTWGSWDPATYAAAAATCGACTSYVYNGDSWGFPSCVDGVNAAETSAYAVSESGYTASATYGGWGSGVNSGFVSTIATGQYPTAISQVTHSWTERPTGSWSGHQATQTPVSDNGCNTPDTRSSWCNGLSIHSDRDTSAPDTGDVCEYDFTIGSVQWDFEGDKRPALAVNGQIPGPAIVCNWGDTVKITVHNALTDNATTIHWHGIRQIGTNDQDGVPGVTECGLAPGDSRVYEFKASSYGTSWYHSHFITQFADGVQGPIIIKGPTSANYDVDLGTVLISDL